ncbi:NAD(P)/FAD-dependent oxidoreductase [Sulfitobacter sp. JL08]|uniref:NAD(P)/FAD-dependent oxidoreductase n=1 Tax=unclassified Sulfitobacter TaxID=196795 RepID=UPI0034A0B8C0
MPAPPPVEEQVGAQTAEWLIIGAGFAGLAAARRLTQLRPKDTIIILDATRIGEGPAGRNSGFMIDLPHDLSSSDYGGALDADRAQTIANRHAIAFAAEMARDFDLSQEAFVQCGKINAAATDAGHRHNLDYARHLTSMGEAHELRSAAQMQAMTGTDYYQSGLFTPHSAMIQPAMFVRGVAKGLRSNRVSIYENSPVVELARPSGWVATTPKGTVTAPNVILAVNGHLNSFGFYRNRLMHVFTYASMTKAMTPEQIVRLGGDPVWGVTPADPMGTTVRRISGTGGDRIVIRNRFTYDPSMTVPDRRITDVGHTHDRAFRARFPMLSDVEMEYRWGGRLCISRNNVQVIGELEPGLFSACCQNGLGTAKGTLAGLLAAELATGHKSAQLDAAAKADQPTRLPPKPLAYLGANAFMRFQERKAGKEL